MLVGHSLTFRWVEILQEKAVSTDIHRLSGHIDCCLS